MANKVRALGLIAAAALAAFSFAPVQGVRWADKAGNMVVTNIKNWRFLPGEGTFKATGSPINAQWKAQGLTINAPSIDGKLSRKGNGWDLATATMSGGIDVQAIRSSSNPASTEKQTVRVKSDSATYSAGDQTIVAKGGLDLSSTDPGADQNLTASGSSGTVNLTAVNSKAGAVQSAVLSGPVKMKMTGRRMEAEEGQAPKKVPYTINGSGNRMEYTSSNRTVTLTGNVVLDGDDPSLGGRVEANRAVITLAASGEVESIELEGDPGRTVIEDKKTGGGGGR